MRTLPDLARQIARISGGRRRLPVRQTPVTGMPRWLGWPDEKAADRSQPGIDEDPFARRRRVEAILLLARESLNSRKLAQYARLADGTQARTVVRALNQLYDHAGRAFRVEEVAGGFRLLTRRQFAPWLRRLGHVPGEQRLSAPAMETLAVVAYRQPVLRAEIESVRGVGCGEILRQLMERDLVRIGGRSEELGRPYLYTTTRYFLQLFGLQNLDQLPQMRELPQEESGGDPASVCPEVSDDPAVEERLEVNTTSLPLELADQPLADELSASRDAIRLKDSTTPADPGSFDVRNCDDEEEIDEELEDDEYDEDDEELEDDEYEYDEYEYEDEDDEDDFDDFEDDEWEEVEDDEELDDDELEDDELEDDWEEDEEDWEEGEWDEEDDEEEDDDGEWE